MLENLFNHLSYFVSLCWFSQPNKEKNMTFTYRYIFFLVNCTVLFVQKNPLWTIENNNNNKNNNSEENRGQEPSGIWKKVIEPPPVSIIFPLSVGSVHTNTHTRNSCGIYAGLWLFFTMQTKVHHTTTKKKNRWVNELMNEWKDEWIF